MVGELWGPASHQAQGTPEEAARTQEEQNLMISKVFTRDIAPVHKSRTNHTHSREISVCTQLLNHHRTLCSMNVVTFNFLYSLPVFQSSVSTNSCGEGRGKRKCFENDASIAKSKLRPFQEAWMSLPMHKLVLPGLCDRWLFLFQRGCSSLGEKLLTETKQLLSLSTLSTTTLCRTCPFHMSFSMVLGTATADRLTITHLFPEPPWDVAALSRLCRGLALSTGRLIPLL